MQVVRQYRIFRSTPPPAHPTDSIPLDLPEQEQKHKSGPYVAFTTNDPSNPQNWSSLYKAYVIGQLTFLTLSLTFASSISSAASSGALMEFGKEENTIGGVATTGAFVVGVGLGAMPFAPLSELYGRLPVYTLTILLATLFEIGCALAPNLPALIILRLFAGFFSAAPLSNAGGSLNDIGNPVFRTLGLPLFTTTGFVGPILGPIIGSYIAQSHLGWRWCYWITAIWNGFSFLLVVICMPETLPGALLKYKAMAWRSLSGEREPKIEDARSGRECTDKERRRVIRWKAEIEDESFGIALQRNLKRPFIMLIKEPILVFFSIYLTVVYTCLYGLFNSYPIVFTAKSLSQTQVGLCFIPVMVGFFLLFGLTLWHFGRYRKLWINANEGKRGGIEPEERLIPLMISSVLFPAGLFWFAWTSDPKYSIWLTMMSGIPFGFGLLAIFQGSYQYMMDAYGPYAASALASLTLTRYGISGLVIMAYPTMYGNLGSEWAGSVFAFLGLALTPVPYLLYVYGRRIRSKCTFTVKT